MLSFHKFQSIDMDGTSMNHYEKQLYSVFKTFDIANEEALDRSAVLELCDALQLDDRGAALVDSLFERSTDRVTFTQFRNGLLSVLGGEPPAPAAAAATAAPPHSDDDSSGREVAPKFVFGSKKYGRRSRPQHPTSDESPRHRVASDSRLDGERARQRMRCKRSASAMENRDGNYFTDDEDPAELDHERRVDRERALTLCRNLRMHGIDRRIVERIFDESSVDEITVGEFFDRLNSSLTSSIAASLDGAASSEGGLDDVVDVVPSDVVVEAWERAGVQRPRRLLLELGFSAAALRPPDLERALDDELQALATSPDEQPDARALLLLAAHTVARLRSDQSRRRLDVAVAERDKLRADLAEANRRARLLAHDVDENHARIEAELKASLRQLEARHADASRAAAAENAAERERAAAARAALEEEVARRADVEARLRADAAAVRARNEELQARACASEERALAAEREAARLAAEARAAGERGARPAAAERRAAAELAARVEELRLENQALRDRSDELCAALEVGARGAAAGAAAAAASWRDEAAALDTRAPDSLLSHERTEECDSSLLSIDQKVFSHNEVVKRLQAIFENVQRISTPSEKTCESCSTLESTIAMIQEKVREISESVVFVDHSTLRTEIGIEIGIQTDSHELKEIETLSKEIASVRQKHDEEKENLSSIIKELESSLEQMKLEYDKCEEYWTCKLEEEREAHGEEQRAGDERLADLVAKIADYERQFAPAVALPPIDERLSLEAQVNDLEEEFAAYRRERDAELAAAREQLARLQAAAAEGAGGGGAGAGGGGGGGEACRCGALAARWRQALGAREAAALRARAGRAERAAQRLHARLAAADLLVKDLYVENCRLAQLPRLP
ncbi:ninein homolog [Epargyreus clarus]|uniref:ninein homolog n=1 Tax=Epargyreus clarus TaxID=520877 RepID=UPI003C2D9CBB